MRTPIESVATGLPCCLEHVQATERSFFDAQRPHRAPVCEPTDMQPPAAAPTSVRWREVLVVAAVCIALAVVLRAPLSLNLWAVPLDPNTPLHAIAARQVAGLGSPTVLDMIDPPNGIPVRIVAWPMVLLAAPFVGTLGALPAVNLATTLLVALQGLGVACTARALRIGFRGQLLGAVAGISAPLILHAQSLGRPENLAFPAFALIAIGSQRSGMQSRVALGALGLLAAAFSSPYQAVPAGLLVLALYGFSGWRPRRAPRPWAEIGIIVALAALPTVLYFIGAAAGDAGESAFTTSPPESTAAAVTGFGELTWPRAMAHGRPVYGLDWSTRWDDLFVGQARFGPNFGVRTASQVSWLGHLLLALGLVGAWKHRHRGGIPPLVLASLAAVLFALGPDLRMWSERPWNIPLPWAGVQLLPGLDALVATSRFLSGTVFALCVAAAALADHWPRRWWLLASAGLIFDGAWRTPRVWPVPAADTPFFDVARTLPPGPVALWPPIDTIPAQNHELAAAIVERHVHMLSLDRETPADWARRLSKQQVASFVNIASLDANGLFTKDGHGVPQEVQDEQARRMLVRDETCVANICWRPFRLESFATEAIPDGER